MHLRRAADHPNSMDQAKTILVVDDEESVRGFVERAMRQAGFRTAVASDGPEALTVAAALDPLHLLITDVRMPQMTGDELARRLRLRDPSLKVLYLTGFSDQLFRERTTLWQDEAFLDKPQGVDALLEAVSLLLWGTTAGARIPASS